MLTLQRASAGSGKTFTLARTFIRHLITEQRDGRTTLREYEALEDAHSHILAVTFTNKATNEMKERIIEKLYALSRTDTPADEIDYLKDFMEEFGVERQEIANRCRAALKYLLLDYSNFNVSTIDSFFQDILRTFAYEAELPDGYKLEIDTDYVSSVGVDTVVEDFKSADLDEESKFWLDILIKEAMANETDWNIVNKRISSIPNNYTLYQRLIKIAGYLGNEDFKTYFPLLEKYIEQGNSLSKAYLEIDNKYMPAIRNAFDNLQDVARRLLRLYSRYTPKGMKDIARNKAISNLRKITPKDASPTNFSTKWEELSGSKTPVNTEGKKVVSKEALDELTTAYNEVSEAYERWQKTQRQPGWMIWCHIRRLIPYLALIHTFKENIRQFLATNNTMVLADTNTILSRIIQDGEVPFIYERLSTHIRHFLIDEFQDTSLMQWGNFRPLLSESMAHGYDNLIIGDAKQSIYRFRNADPSIISEKVPATFSGHDLNICGERIEQNSNWRSDLRIVQFNNYIFSRFHQEFGHILGNLYEGAVQQPRKKQLRGYVEWVPAGCKASPSATPDETLIGEEEEDTGKNSDAQQKIKLLKNAEKWLPLGPMISEMLGRGYRQKDIAILCKQNDTGIQIIDALMAYNNMLEAGQQELRFISEQSLQLRSNRAVRIVISALQSLADGIYYPGIEEIPVDDEGKRVDWRSISVQFILYSNAHTDIPLEDRVRNFLSDARHDDTLSEMVSQMQATTLPALVEAIIDMFLHNSRAGGGKTEDTPFLAALQDAVLDYSSRYVADIASFLTWWTNKGQYISIASPEDTDAINIMTIHKSKGLEYECVILPDIEKSLTPGANRAPWKWAEVPESFTYKSLLPDYMPVEVTSRLTETSDEPAGGDMAETPYAPLWDEECKMVLTDVLNTTYVAFTRAVSELYILSDGYCSTGKDPKVVEDKMHIKNKLAKYLKTDVVADDSRTADGTYIHLRPEQLAEPEEFEGIYYGTKPTAEDVKKRVSELENKKNKDKDVKSEDMTGYFINAAQPILHFVEEEQFDPKPEDDDTLDPESEGTLIHAILEHTYTYDDLPGAITRARLRGLLNTPQAIEMEEMLREALEATRGTNWFDGSLYPINERPLIAPDMPRYRPDRLLVTSDKKVIIVDYKTGTSEKNYSHRSQVRRYMRLLMQTGRFKEAEGWLWYVKEGKIEKVEFA